LLGKHKDRRLSGRLEWVRNFLAALIALGMLCSGAIGEHVKRVRQMRDGEGQVFKEQSCGPKAIEQLYAGSSLLKRVEMILT